MTELKPVIAPSYAPISEPGAIPGTSSTVVSPSPSPSVAILTDAERVALREQLESTVDNGLQSFIAMGDAIRTIKDQELYKPEYDEFDDYAEARFGFGRRRANQLIANGEVGKILLAAVPNAIRAHGLNDAHAHALVGLPADAASIVYAKAISAGSSRITARLLSDVRNDLYPPTSHQKVKKRTSPNPNTEHAELKSAELDTITVTEVSTLTAFLLECVGVPKRLSACLRSGDTGDLGALKTALQDAITALADASAVLTTFVHNDEKDILVRVPGNPRKVGYTAEVRGEIDSIDDASAPAAGSTATAPTDDVTAPCEHDPLARTTDTNRCAICVLEANRRRASLSAQAATADPDVAEA